MQEFNKHEIFWHSRRGMLELDLLLVPFAREVFESLSHPDQMLYSELLEFIARASGAGFSPDKLAD